jgi:hypothetical protein
VQSLVLQVGGVGRGITIQLQKNLLLQNLQSIWRRRRPTQSCSTNDDDDDDEEEEETRK